MEEFYSYLTNRKISDKEYQYFLKIWDKFEMKTMEDYHGLYLKWYRLLLADVFEEFWNNSLNQCLRHNLGYKQKITQFIRRNQVYFSSSNVSTDTTVIVKDYMLSEKFTFCFKITIKWNLTKSHATRLK